MTAKEYLSQIPALNRTLTWRLQKHEQMKASAELAASVISDMPHPSSRDPHKGEAKRVAVIDDAHEINELTDRYIDLVHEATILIGQIPCANHNVIKVLDLKYMKEKTWEEIASELHITVRHAHKLHGKGLIELDRILESEDTEVHKLATK